MEIQVKKIKALIYTKIGWFRKRTNLQLSIE